MIIIYHVYIDAQILKEVNERQCWFSEEKKPIKTNNMKRFKDPKDNGFINTTNQPDNELFCHIDSLFQDIT